MTTVETFEYEPDQHLLQGEFVGDLGTSIADNLVHRLNVAYGLKNPGCEVITHIVDEEGMTHLIDFVTVRNEEGKEVGELNLSFKPTEKKGRFLMNHSSRRVIAAGIGVSVIAVLAAIKAIDQHKHNQ